MSIALFAYHELGHQALQTLLAEQAPVVGVFTYEDDPDENCWFGSVSELARDAGIPTFTPADVNQPEWVAKLRELAPEVLLSVHYRHMLKRPIRRVPSRGCLNLHTSLLPKYRGRCPLNWQLVHGERESGVTLHEMVARADAGAIVDQERVAVGPEDTALELYQKLLPAARAVLTRQLPAILAGAWPRREQDEARVTKFGGRGPEDGRIDWSAPAQRIHDLVRAVSRPWPGAFCDVAPGRVMVWRTRVAALPPSAEALEPGATWSDPAGRAYVRAGEGCLELLDFELPEGLSIGDGLASQAAGVSAS
ncbi:MAG: formyltransferase [Planctomycetes bacterium]|nr:formyltransferase [Planctomycetota bacterium]